ncbi:MAG: hypothetical protein ACOX4B_00855 [Bacillota bacterium]|jgi:hypothetical protein|nr:flagellar protein FliT [Candidatus Fermentithermobacillaceae bacterium]
MGTAREDVAVIDAIRRLVTVTRAVRDSAVARDFEALPEAIGKREEIISSLKSRGGVGKISTARRNEAIEALLKIREMEAEVVKVFESEMDRDNQAIEDVTAKVKALSAYERLVPKPRRFDTHK